MGAPVWLTLNSVNFMMGVVEGAGPVVVKPSKRLRTVRAAADVFDTSGCGGRGQHVDTSSQMG